jgi:hypothetical protein
MAARRENAESQLKTMQTFHLAKKQSVINCHIAPAFPARVKTGAEYARGDRHH